MRFRLGPPLATNPRMENPVNRSFPGARQTLCARSVARFKSPCAETLLPNRVQNFVFHLRVNLGEAWAA